MKIILATGGTGGHLFPALKVAEELGKKRNKVFFLGSFGPREKYLKDHGFAFKDLRGRGLNAVSVRDDLAAGAGILRASWEAFFVLKEFAPDAVVGFGGYGSFPAVFAAVMVRVPALIHEQNVVPGRANAFLGRLVKKVAVSFPETKKYFPKGKIVVTGCPCRIQPKAFDRGTLLKKFGLEPGRKTLLVSGGSQGSRVINVTFLSLLPQVKELKNIQIIHLAGAKDHADLKAAYDRENIPHAVFEFFDRMEEAYAAADLVIARAGAMTVNEIAMFQRPAILSPYPYAQGHQKENAKALCRSPMARMIEQKDLTPENLAATIKEMLEQQIENEPQVPAYTDIYIPNAAGLLCEEIERLKW